MKQHPRPLNKPEDSLDDTSIKSTPPMVCIVGFSGSGKTTLIAGLVSALKQWGYRVGTIKHDVHGFEIDQPGKDSWRHKQAGASTTIISSPSQIGMVKNVAHDHHPQELLPLLTGMDIVLVEGFKRSELPKIEVFRQENGKPPACMNDRYLMAVVSDATLDWDVPQYAANDYEPLAEWIIKQFKLDSMFDRASEQLAFGYS